MYARAKALLLALMRVPETPAAPEGSAASLRVFRASPAYLRYRTLGWMLGQAWLVFVACMGLFAVAQIPASGGAAALILVAEILAWLGLVGGVAFSYLVLKLDYELRWYVVTDRSLRIREGAWNVHEMTMTFANIQNISVSQGPLQRAFGIADLRVQSAGGGGASAEGPHGRAGMKDLHVGWFRGVDDAHAIRDLILERLRRLKDAGLGDEDDDHVVPESIPATGRRLGPVLSSLRDEAALLRMAAERVAERAR